MLQVRNLSFRYDKGNVLENISFNVKEGENIAIIGESGSGKSTLLKLIYGHYDLDGGTIFWKDNQILGPKYNLVVGYDFVKEVAQEFDLIPALTVEESIGKFLSRFEMEKRQNRIDELLSVVELEPFSKTKVKFLSGGQKQRVAIARALAKEPQVLLLDEPFSHIDNFKKQSLRRGLFNYLKNKGITCLVTTHDKNDVLGFANTMMVLHNQHIISKGNPEYIFNNPGLPRIASFFGDYSIIDERIYYSHQLLVVEKSNFKAEVKRSYFSGEYWLIEAIHNNNTIYLQHSLSIGQGTKIFFELVESKNLI